MCRERENIMIGTNNRSIKENPKYTRSNYQGFFLPYFSSIKRIKLIFFTSSDTQCCLGKNDFRYDKTRTD